MENALKIWEKSALAALCLTLLLSAWAQGTADSISGSLIRMHVIAQSDDDYEQNLKLRVRDSVLEYLEPKLQNAANSEEAHEILFSELKNIRSAAEKVSEGREIQVALSREAYPTRKCEDYTLPAGNYESLRVIIGEGKGHNWWCVVFPPVCLTDAESETPAHATMVTGADGYEIRFKLVELWGETVNFLRGVSFSVAQRDEGVGAVGGH